MPDCHYKYCAVQIVGSPGDWDYAYYPSDDKYASVRKAQRAGLRELGHDDFIVAEFNGERCVAVHVGDEGRHTADSEDFGGYVSGINRELGLEENDPDA